MARPLLFPDAHTVFASPKNKGGGQLLGSTNMTLAREWEEMARPLLFLDAHTVFASPKNKGGGQLLGSTNTTCADVGPPLNAQPMGGIAVGDDVSVHLQLGCVDHVDW